MSNRNHILKLYKSLIRESQKFTSYNFRSYAIRRVRDAFKENKAVTDPDILRNKIAEANKNLEIIKRQAVISQLYQADKLIIENIPRK